MAFLPHVTMAYHLMFLGRPIDFCPFYKISNHNSSWLIFHAIKQSQSIPSINKSTFNNKIIITIKKKQWFSSPLYFNLNQNRNHQDGPPFLWAFLQPVAFNMILSITLAAIANGPPLWSLSQSPSNFKCAHVFDIRPSKEPKTRLLLDAFD